MSPRGDTAEYSELVGEGAIALDIGRDIFYREMIDDLQHLKHAPQNRKTKSKFSSLFSLSSSSFLFTFFCSNELSRKKEKNNDRLRSHDCTRTRPGHPHESRNDERDEEEIGYLARMGERFKGIISR